MSEFKKGDRIIWDSGWGYEIGCFIEYNEVIGYGCKTDLKTGVVTGETLRPLREVVPYTDEAVKERTKKYGYEKRFSEIF